jgi:hypothetical protein
MSAVSKVVCIRCGNVRSLCECADRVAHAPEVARAKIESLQQRIALLLARPHNRHVQVPREELDAMSLECSLALAALRAGGSDG